MKKLLSILLIFSLIAGLSGCHGNGIVRETTPTLPPETQSVLTGDTPDKETEPTEAAPALEFDTSRNYEISFWAKNDTNITQVNIYKQAIADFEALYPNIKVNLRLYTDYGKIYNDVITNIATDTTPNVCITYPDHIATYLTGSDTVVSLDGLMADANYGLGGSELRFDGPIMEEIIPQFLEECSIKGSYYALPYMRSTEACYVNKTYVENLGYTLPEVLTWDFIWEVSEAAMEKDADGNYKVNGQKVLIPFIYKSTDNMMIQLLRQRNAGYSTPAGKIELFNEITEEILLQVAEHAKTGAFDTFKRIGYPANFLNAGQCIFAVDSTAGATWMGSDAPLVDIAEENLVQFETVVMPIPQYDTENPVMISQGPSMCVFYKEDSQEVLASWLFAQYMLTNKVQIAYSQTEGYAPVTSKAQQSAEYQDYLSRCGEDNDLHYRVKIEATKLLMENTENTFVTPVFNGSASLRNAAGHLIETVNKSVHRKQTVDATFLQELFLDTIDLHKLDQIKIDESYQEPTVPSDEENSTNTPETPDSGSPSNNDLLGNRNPSGDGANDLDPIPAPSVILLCSLGGIWLFLGAYAFYQHKKRKKT